MGLTKPIGQYLFSNLLIEIHVFMYLKDIIREGLLYEFQFKENRYDSVDKSEESSECGEECW